MKHIPSLQFFLAIALCACSFTVMHGQPYFEIPKSLETRITEPNPEASALRRYSDVPVSYSAGSAIVDIPLIDVTSGELGVSFSLSYNTSARRATDLPGYTGIGWSLRGLGRVSRQVVGLPDEKIRANVDVPTPEIPNEPIVIIDTDKATKYLSQEVDCQYDIFSYDLPGYGGSFIIDGDDNIHLLPQQDITISFQRAPTTGPNANELDKGEITEFTIETFEGLIYTFCDVERMEYRNVQDPVSSDKNSSEYECPVTWNLSLIQTHDKKQQVRVEYDTLKKWTRGHSLKLKNRTISWTEINKLPENASTGAPLSFIGPHSTFENPLVPKAVTLNNSRIEFDHSPFSYSPDKGTGELISGIRLYNSDGLCVKEVSLSYGNDEMSLPVIGEINVTSENTCVDYRKMQYHPIPAGEMYDIFGVFNGEDEQYAYYSIYDENGKLSTSRASNPKYAAAGVLSSITDAMGCITSFEYEPKNYIVTGETSSQTYQIGRRIKTIKAESPQTSRIRTRTFFYSDSITTVDLSKIGLEAWCALSGTIADDNSAGSLLSYTKRYSLTASMTSSSRVAGMGVENTDILYKKVTEEVSGTGIDKALRTSFIFDLSDAVHSIRHGDNYCHPEPNQTLQGPGTLPYNCPSSIGEFFEPKWMSYFIKQNYGGAPLLKEKIVYEWRNGAYHPYETERHTYRSSRKLDVVLGLHCESVTFREEKNWNSIPEVHNPNDVLCFLFYAQSVTSIPDSVTTTRHYPDGNSRTITAALRYASDYYQSRPTILNGNIHYLQTYFITEVPGDSVQAHLGYNVTRPVSTVLSCGGQNLSRTEVFAYNVATSGIISRFAQNGYRSLPIKQVWIANQTDTMMISNEYGTFYNVPRLTRQWLSRGSHLIQEQRFTSYTSHGFPLSGVSSDGVNISWAWGDNDCLTQKTIFPNLNYKYDHIHLVGCTQIKRPSGQFHTYKYSGGRLIAEADCWNNTLRTWNYGLFKDSHDNYVQTGHRTASGMVYNREYYDAFGMPYFNVTLNGSEPGTHIFSATKYDALDRLTSSTLPVPDTSIPLGSEAYDYSEQQAQSYYSDNSPVTRFVYPANFDSNPSHIYKAGAEFESHPIVSSRECNSKASPELRCWKFGMTADGYVERNGYWADGSLEVVRTIDPDGNMILTFTDWRGLTLLERRKIKESSYADTYYIYDSWGNPLVVLTPEYVQEWTQTYGREPLKYSTALKQNAYYYVYDSAGRIKEKRLPGCEPESYFYDSKGRIAFSQDGEQKAAGRCMIYLYDQTGRLVIKGECLSSVIPAEGAESLDMTVSYMGAGGSLNGYSHKLGRLPGLEILETNYFDHYHFLSLSGMPALPGFSSTSYSSGLLTGHLEAILHPEIENSSLGSSTTDSTPYNILTAYQYDYEERVTKTVSSTVSSDIFESTQTLYNIASQPTSITRSIMNKDGSVASSEKSSMLYDNLGRLLSTASKLDSSTSVEVSRLGYDGVGQLATERTMAGTTTYTFDLNSQLITLDTPCFLQDFTYSPAGLIIGRTTSQKDGKTFSSKFTYDGMARLLSVNTTGAIAVYTSGPAPTGTLYTGSMTEASYTYDRNSNITALTRRRFGEPGGILLGGLGTKVLPVITTDNLSLNYNGNQLLKVTDDITSTIGADGFDFHDGADDATEYTYDSCGRMTSDLNRGIESIEWSITGRPMRMRLANGCRIDYFYSASGTKLREQLWEPQYISGGGASSLLSDNGSQRAPIGGGGTIIIPLDSIKVNRIIEDHRWINNFEFERDSLTRINHSKGYWADGSFHTYLLDWQGNVSAVVNQNGKVEQSTLYYSYGLPFVSTNPEVNPYKFSGKELDMRFGLNMAHHGARLYFPDLGIFLSPDIMSESYRWLSPYLYCAGNPLNLIDPSGNKWDKMSRIDDFISYVNRALDRHKMELDNAEKNGNDKMKENAQIAIEHLEETLRIIDEIAQSEQTFCLRDLSGDGESYVEKDGDLIYIRGISGSFKGHEIRHVGQWMRIRDENKAKFFDENGRMLNPSKRPFNRALNEVEAYQTQYALDDEDFLGSPSDISDVTMESILRGLMKRSLRDNSENVQGAINVFKEGIKEYNEKKKSVPGFIERYGKYVKKQ